MEHYINKIIATANIANPNIRAIDIGVLRIEMTFDRSLSVEQANFLVKLANEQL